MTWTLCTSGAAIIKAGRGASQLITLSGAFLANFSNESEAFINTDSRYDWIANYSTLQANFKQALADLCSDLIAMKIVLYDMRGYNSIREATTILDVLKDNIERSLKNLREDKYREVVTG